MTAIHISYSPFWQDGLFNDPSLALDPDTHLTTWAGGRSAIAVHDRTYLL